MGDDFLPAEAKIDCPVLLSVVERSGHIVLRRVEAGGGGRFRKELGGLQLLRERKKYIS